MRFVALYAEEKKKDMLENNKKKSSLEKYNRENMTFA